MEAPVARGLHPYGAGRTARETAFLKELCPDLIRPARSIGIELPGVHYG
jgi:hypothetical protein